MSDRKSLAPPESDSEEDPEVEEIDDGEEEDGFDMDGGFGMDIGAMLDPYLATEDGDTVATALVAISKHMENQNKILIKILSAINAAGKKP